MTCILCFLDDDHQEHLRQPCSSNHERFEDVLGEYLLAVRHEFDNLVPVEACRCGQTLHQQMLTWTKDFAAHMKSAVDLGGFADTIARVYRMWLDYDTAGSLHLLRTSIENHDIFGMIEKYQNYMFFRGRRSGTQLQIRDMYHIPFSQRWRVLNQRFSVSGHPCLYLGLSTAVVREEAGLQTLSDLQISSYILKANQHLKVVRLSNAFPRFASILGHVAEENVPLSYADDSVYPGRNDWLSSFYRFILGCACSFKRRNAGGAFAEEYVLPQLVTECAHQMGYEGICYSSTKLYTDRYISKADFHVNTHRENIVLFTEYSEASDHDEGLLGKFVVSKPLNATVTGTVTVAQVQSLGASLRQRTGIRDAIPNIDAFLEYTGLKQNSDFRDLYVVGAGGSQVPYFDTEDGKLQLYLLHQLLSALDHGVK